MSQLKKIRLLFFLLFLLCQSTLFAKGIFIQKVHYMYEYFELSKIFNDGFILDITNNLGEVFQGTNTNYNVSLTGVNQLNDTYTLDSILRTKWISLIIQQKFISKNINPINTLGVADPILRYEIMYYQITPIAFVHLGPLSLGAGYHMGFNYGLLPFEQTWDTVIADRFSFYFDIYQPLIKKAIDFHFRWRLNTRDFTSSNAFHTIQGGLVIHFSYYTQGTVEYQRIFSSTDPDKVIDSWLFNFNYQFNKWFYMTTDLGAILYAEGQSPGYRFGISGNLILNLWD